MTETQPINHTEAPPRPTGSNLAGHAWDELNRAGLFDADADYGGMLGRAVLELVEVFAGQGHSGFSAAAVTDMFSRLTRFEPLSELTDDPDEWFVHSDDMWQSKRMADAFSNDQGRTYRRLDVKNTTFTSRRVAEQS